MEDRGTKILRAHRLVLDVGSMLIGFAIDSAATDAAASDDRRVAARPVLLVMLLVLTQKPIWSGSLGIGSPIKFATDDCSSGKWDNGQAMTKAACMGSGSNRIRTTLLQFNGRPRRNRGDYSDAVIIHAARRS